MNPGNAELLRKKDQKFSIMLNQNLNLMRLKNGCQKVLLGLAVIATPFFLGSCSDDGGSNDPSVEKGTVDGQVSGSVNLDLSKGDATFSQNTREIPQSGNEITSATVTWQGSSPGNQITLEVTNAAGSDIETGKYPAISASPTETKWIGSSTSIMIDSFKYNLEMEETSSIKVTTKNDTELIGKINDLKFRERFESDTVILNGAFHATK